MLGQWDYGVAPKATPSLEELIESGEAYSLRTFEPVTEPVSGCCSSCPPGQMCAMVCMPCEQPREPIEQGTEVSQDPIRISQQCPEGQTPYYGPSVCDAVTGLCTADRVFKGCREGTEGLFRMYRRLSQEPTTLMKLPEEPALVMESTAMVAPAKKKIPTPVVVGGAAALAWLLLGA